jgi:hypothetical protein
MSMFAREAEAAQRASTPCRAAVLLLALWLAPSLLSAAPFRLTQGANSWDVGFVHRLLSYDMMEAPDDPGGLATVAPDADSPWDDAPGTLYDGNLHYYRVLEKGQDIATWYAYDLFNNSSAAFGITVSDTTRVFLYMDNTTGRLSLVVVHDKPNDGGGGVADWSFTGLPPTAALDVEDEPNGGGDTYDLDAVAGTLQVHWQWLICCTDGLAVGGLEQQSWSITITPSFGANDSGIITAMEFLHGDSDTPDVIPLILTEPFTIETTGEAYGPHRVTLAVTDSLANDSPRLSWPDMDRASVAVDPSTSAVGVFPDCTTADGLMRATAWVTPKDAAGDRLGSGLQVALDPVPMQPGWYDGPVQDRINGHYTAPVVSDTLGAGTVNATVEGIPLLGSDDILFVGTVPEAAFTHDGPAGAGVQVCFRNRSTGGALPYVYAWDLNGDGVTDSGTANPCHIYEEPGEYWPGLRITDFRGCISWTTTLLEIFP